MIDKIATLTIDDAPSSQLDRKIDFLTARGIQAVLFCRGESLEQYPDQAINAIRRGFILGNHSYDHPYFSDLTLADCRDQITRTDRLIDAIYAQAGQPRPARFFRFPFGDKGGLMYGDAFSGYSDEGMARKQQVQDTLRALGYTKPAFPGVTYHYYHAAGLHTDVDWYWTYDTVDWGPISDDPPWGIDSLEKILARMEENEPEHCRGLNTPGSDEIVLIHDLEQTAPFFFTIMERLLTKGIRFQPVPLD